MGLSPRVRSLLGLKVPTVVTTNETVYPEKTGDVKDGSSGDEEPENAEVGELSFEEDTRGGLGRHLGIVSTTFLM